ncbi:hypothetical protein PAESOLCIP111_06274 [Paenibacillus solanacearum]|uniref:VOC family protein n=1 Tax=Paenibacillus solanacearum TaxID=2048548 RepID=A0A916NST6_9BACL|nr:hypothetical protein [Paenibacillus solanacearum]CAG7651245.1 hypothetical protein PAESOLCIP111_06274 [Paenibacillus solanacearum]
MNKFSHIDVRVHSWEQARPFYENMLHALGFCRTFSGTLAAMRSRWSIG